MINCTCLIQEGQIAHETEAALRAGLSQFTQDAFKSDAQINWIAVPKGSGFTAAAPSTSALVSMQAPAPVDQNQRAVLLNELCGMWAAETGCTRDEIVGVISDPTPA